MIRRSDFLGRAAAEHDRHLDSPPERGHLVLDAGLEVAQEVDRDVVLVDHVPLLVVQPGDPFPGSPGEADHVALGPDAADVLRDVAGRVGQVVDLEAHADTIAISVPDQRGIGHFAEERL